jgi:hypothetical protein
VYGEYFKYLDELARSLDGFKILWRQKKYVAVRVPGLTCRWTLFPLTDAVWAMFYYTQLYICAFSFVSEMIWIELMNSKHTLNEQPCEQMRNTRSSRNNIKPADQLPTYHVHPSVYFPEGPLLVPMLDISCSVTMLLGPYYESASITFSQAEHCLIYLRDTSCGSLMLLSFF